MSAALLDRAGTYRLGDRTIRRIGYGAMQLAGPGVFGPPRDHDEAVAVLREAIASGVDHIDTCDYYGPYVVNRLIREALAPYPDNLLLVTKVGARRGPDASWNPAHGRDDLIRAIHENCENLGIERVEVVNLRMMTGDMFRPGEGSLAEPLEVLTELREQGLIGHIGLSHVTRRQIEEGRTICPIACVQNMYNLAHREDDELIDQLAAEGIPYVPFFPLGGFAPLQSQALDAVAADLGAKPMQVAQAWLLQRSPNILLIPGTSSRVHLRENLAIAELELDETALARLDAIGRT